MKVFCSVGLFWRVGALVRLMGWGIVRGEREREGGLKRRKKSAENRDGIILIGFSLFLFQVSMFGLAREGGRKRRRGGQYCFFFFFFFFGLATYLTLPYLAFEEETPNMYTVGQ